jgi:hypothetical protein
MTIDVVVYLSSLQKIAGRKQEVLEAFGEGARRCGARVVIQRQMQYVPARLAVILGWPSPEQHTSNIRLRAAVVKEQKRSRNHVMAIDGSTFKFHDPEGKYLRYSLNGVFYDTSEYANKNSDSSRWNLIQQDLGLWMSPWKTQGSHIVFLMQRDGGWSMKGLNPIQWVVDTYSQVRSVSNLPIMIRPHPGKKIDLSPIQALPGVIIVDSKNTTLQDNFVGAKAACVFNSSSGVASVLQGVPLIVNDRSSVCWDVSDYSVDAINNPSLKDRTQWINDLAAAHWSDDESRQGLVFQRFMPYFS